MAKPFVNPFLSGQFLELRVDALVSDGRGLGRHDGVVVLVEDALPGQRVRARVSAVRKSLAEAELVGVLERSPDEQEPPCPHAGRCGGCSWQSLAYGRQLVWKERIVRDALERVGKVQDPPVLPILASPGEWGYRNKMEFAFGPSEGVGKAIGLRERGSRDIVAVTGCLLQTPLTMRVLEAVRELAGGAFRDLDGRFLVVREPKAGGCFVELIVGPGCGAEAGGRFAAALRAEVSGVTGFALSERSAPSDVAYGERTLYADGRLEERIGDILLQMGHNAFFQVNTPAAELLYVEAARFAALDELPDPVLWDVYGGVGAIGLFIGSKARVVGIEEMPGAVRYARANAKALGRKAYRVEQGDAKSVLGRLAKLGPKPDVVVVDPPRAGLDAKVAQQLAGAAPLRLVYVSCNPATLARDVARLAPAFRLKAARPVDLFPQTPHVETVALLERV
ncbi:class I SAM-dependent RNA methyltransferase [uncultured Bilophila sp.]|uniref:class I SAM-dependent RNA methyltransferase n=1 Tax=uncultured Bilophila sp. TaxID=529385 RepID=UPI00280B2D95|nr:class I SAM-dependent RNA methyltransferase [uncultured Bilophila sp.]